MSIREFDFTVVMDYSTAAVDAGSAVDIYVQTIDIRRHSVHPGYTNTQWLDEHQILSFPKDGMPYRGRILAGIEQPLSIISFSTHCLARIQDPPILFDDSLDSYCHLLALTLTLNRCQNPIMLFHHTKNYAHITLIHTFT